MKEIIINLDEKEIMTIDNIEELQKLKKFKGIKAIDMYMTNEKIYMIYPNDFVIMNIELMDYIMKNK